MKKLLSKRVLLIVLPLLLIAGLVGGAVVLVPRLVTTPFQIMISTGAEATVTPAGKEGRERESEGSPAKAELPTLPYTTRERVVNLADKGGFRYLKAEIVLDVVIPHSKPGDKPPSGEAVKEVQKELEAALVTIKPRLEDAINMTLASKTSEELMTPEGKQRLRDELRAKLDRLSVENPIMGVYFTQFIIQ